MSKLKVTILAVVVAAVIIGDAGSEYTGRFRNWPKSRGFDIKSSKCSKLNGLLPVDPQSGCCGKHETDSGNDDNGIGDEEDQTGNEYDDNDIGEEDQDNDNDLEEDENDGFEFDNSDGEDNGIGGWDIDDDDMIPDWTDWFRFKRSTDNDSDVTPEKFITAGKPTKLNQYPWLVHLNIKVKELQGMAVYGCGGSLISPRFVLTAAHCVKMDIQSNNDVNVYLAEYNTKTFPEDCVGNKCVKNIIMHPDKIIIHNKYNRDTLHNDIAMLRLKGSAPYTEYIRPICLPPFNIDSPDNNGHSLTISGWGHIGTNRPSSPIKLAAPVHLVSQKKCKNAYSDLFGGQICAAGDAGQDTCSGDSGGPLMMNHEGHYYLVGIVSGKRADVDCGDKLPSLYTNVFSYIKWIKQNMKH